MRENAAQGKGMLDEIGYTIGPMHLRIGDDFQGYLHPGFFLGMGYGLAAGSFDSTATLLSGTAVFEIKKRVRVNGTDSAGTSATIGNVVFIDKTPQGLQNPSMENMQRIYGHEQVHAAQYRSFGTLELALRQSESYRTYSDQSHLVHGADVLGFGLFMLSYPLDHNDKPIELVSERLEEK